MSTNRFGAICPIAHACRVLEPRWTIPIITELWAGSTRFNEIRKGVGNISPGLLSRRLRELEDLGMIRRVEDAKAGTVDYFRTEKAIRLEPALNALGVWAQQNIAAEIALDSTDVTAMMWRLRRNIRTEHFAGRRVIIEFRFLDADPAANTYWLVFYPDGQRDLCKTSPRRDVDLFIETTLVSLGAVMTARSTLGREMDTGALFVSGDTGLARSMKDWLPFSVYRDVGQIAQLPVSGAGGGRARRAENAVRSP